MTWYAGNNSQSTSGNNTGWLFNTADPAIGVLVLTGLQPTIATTDNRTAAPATGALVLTGSTPTVFIASVGAVAQGVVSISGQQPTITVAVNISPATGTLTATGQAPSAERSYKFEIGTGNLVVGTYNWCPNSTCQGAVVGVLGSGGALPTGWNINSPGAWLTREVTAIGNLGDGTPYIDYRLSGTNPGATVYPDLYMPPSNTNPIWSGVGAKWTASIYLSLIAGSRTGFGGPININISGVTSSNGYCGGGGVAATDGVRSSSGTITLAVYNGVIPTRAAIYVSNSINTSATVDCTLRVAMPMLERSTSMSAYVPTYGSSSGQAGPAPTPVVANLNAVSAGAITLTGSIPTVSIQGVMPGLGALTLTGQQPVINVRSVFQPALDALVLTGNAPTVVQNVIKQRAQADLVLTSGAAPSLLRTFVVLPAAGAINFTGQSPITGASLVFTPAIKALTLSGQVPTLYVEGVVLVSYRWRNDDGTEATATWKGAQDATVSVSNNTGARLRLVVNGLGDPAANQFQLEYRKVGDTDWVKVA